MNCNKCGALLENNSTFCKNCGTPVTPQPIEGPIQATQPVGPQPIEAGPIPAAQPVGQQPIEAGPIPVAQPVTPQPIEAGPIPAAQPVGPQPIEAGPIPVAQSVTPQPIEAETIVVDQPVQPTQQPIPNPQLEQLNYIKQNEVNPMGLELPSFEPIKENETKRKKHSILPIILILLIILGIGGFIAYKYFFTPSNKVVIGIINGTYDKLENVIDKSQAIDFENNSITVIGDLVLDTNIEGLEDLKNIKFNYKSGIDYKNKKMEFGGSISENNVNLINVIMYMLDNNAYISFIDDYDGLLKIDTTEKNLDELMAIEKTKFTKEDIKFILESYKNILIESLDMNDFKKSQANIIVDGQETNVSKYTYDLNNENIEKLSSKIIDKSLQNQELLATLAKISEKTVEEIKSELEQSKFTPETKALNFTINFYTKGVTNDFVGVDILNETIGNVEVRINKNSTIIDLKNNNETLATYIIKSNSKEDITIEFESFQEKKSGSINLTSKEIDSNNYEGTIKFNYNFNGQTFTASSNYTMKIGNEIANIDVTGAKPMEELTEEEQAALYEKIMPRIENSKLYSFINSFLSTESYETQGEINNTL